MRTTLTFIILLLGISNISFSQDDDKVRLIQADRLKGRMIDGKRVNMVIGNVIFKHKDATLYCDSAYQDKGENVVQAYGRSRVQKGDSITMWADELRYFGNDRKAKASTNVVLKQGSTTLNTDNLDFNLEEDLAYYYNGGKIRDGKTRLTSQVGIYDTENRSYAFRDSIVIRGDGYKLVSDTLNYFTRSKIARFFGPTWIYSQNDRTLYAEVGEYKTVSQRSYFKKNGWLEDNKYRLEGDSLYFDNLEDFGYSFGNVYLEAKKDSLIILGDEAIHKGYVGESTVFGNPLMKKLQGVDTLYLSADTLVSQQDTLDRRAQVRAYFGVLVFHENIQASCDSLVYDLADSTISFFEKPIVWSTPHQITADTIDVLLNEEGAEKIFARSHSFIISEDTITEYYNQVKGRQTVASFENNDLKRVDVDGNGESLYFARQEGQASVMGMNLIKCSKMVLTFVENDLNDITFLTEPKANFTPPQLINSSNNRLEQFRWLEDIKPTKAQLLNTRNPQPSPKTEETIKPEPETNLPEPPVIEEENGSPKFEKKAKKKKSRKERKEDKKKD